jgi:hypothetical protein
LEFRSRSACSALLAALGLALASPAAAWEPLAHLYGSDLLAGSGESAPSPAALASAAVAAVTSAALARQEEAPAEAAPRAPGSKKKALLLSFLLPGAGELSLGERGRATGFFLAEGAIWTHFTWFTVAGHLRRDDYIEQAQRNAGIGVDDEEDDYWRLVGQYDRSSGSGADAYEEDLRREARDLYPGDPAAQDAWVAERLPSGDRAWSWSSSELRESYRETRERSRRAFDRAKYSFAAAILNRIVSVIDTQVLHNRLERDARLRGDGGSFRLAADALPDGGGRVVLTRAF